VDDALAEIPIEDVGNVNVREIIRSVLYAIWDAIQVRARPTHAGASSALPCAQTEPFGKPNIKPILLRLIKDSCLESIGSLTNVGP
jgi:hypothetical protein